MKKVQQFDIDSFPKAYDPASYEHAIYTKWEQSGFFDPDTLPGKRDEMFSVMMPPPNVTGILHIGHALENTIMDAKIRFERMRGKRTVLVPGTDHAAVATQARVEKDLVEQGHAHPREEFGREKLLQLIRDYSEKSKATIIEQIKRLGTSCDWSRLAYTFDEQRSQTVYAVFKSMYDDGLIYRGYRVVNWSTKGQSTCSDDELVYIERDAKLYTFKYSKDFPIPVATTRPETKLGDTAVAVHPDDSRYAKYIGKTFTVDVGSLKPLQIKIVGDDSVDMTFGTGAVGVTPAHSMVDYEMKERHGLELVSVIGTDGKMTDAAGIYKGMTVQTARDAFVAWLEKQELLISVENVKQNVATSDRFGDVIEVLPMLQWFVAVNKPIARKGNKTLKELMHEYGEQITIKPDNFKTIYFRWIDNLRDWCISRQIWWGHRIPVWYCVCGEVVVSVDEPQETCRTCGKREFTRDDDTLDTWFSSGTWTFSTLGWPGETKDLMAFHPTSWMQMGYELVFFWMARMILMSAYALDQIPFKEVYIHGLVRDAQGKKFSKSLRNTIDPMDMIAKYGTDALRMSLVSGVTPGNDLTFYEDKVQHYQHFVNKLWNISRYVFGSVGKPRIIENIPKSDSIADQWIIGKLGMVIQGVTDKLAGSDFSIAAQLLYDFIWSDFADWYIEVAKIESKLSDAEKEKKDEIVLFVLQHILHLAHPFMPFVTEAIWAQFNTQQLLIVSDWPKIDAHFSSEAAQQFFALQELVVTIRNYRSEHKVPMKDRLEVTVKVPYDGCKEVIEQLARCTITLGTSIVPQIAEVSTLTDAKRKELTEYIALLEMKLANKAFVKNAKPEVVALERKKLADAKEKLRG